MVGSCPQPPLKWLASARVHHGYEWRGRVAAGSTRLDRRLATWTEVMNAEIPKHIEAALDDAYCAGPAKEELILTVEQSLGVAFPSQYRAFLRRYGAALLRGVELYGITNNPGNLRDKPPQWTDLRMIAHYTLPEGLPRKVIPISSNGGDYTYYLTIEAKGKVAAASVVAYGPGLDGVQVASDFFDFIEKAISKGTQSFLEPYYES